MVLAQIPIANRQYTVLDLTAPEEFSDAVEWREIMEVFGVASPFIRNETYARLLALVSPYPNVLIRSVWFNVLGKPMHPFYTSLKRDGKLQLTAWSAKFCGEPHLTYIRLSKRVVPMDTTLIRKLVKLQLLKG